MNPAVCMHAIIASICCHFSADYRKITVIGHSVVIHASMYLCAPAGTVCGIGGRVAHPSATKANEQTNTTHSIYYSTYISRMNSSAQNLRTSSAARSLNIGLGPLPEKGVLWPYTHSHRHTDSILCSMYSIRYRVNV